MRSALKKFGLGLSGFLGVQAVMLVYWGAHCTSNAELPFLIPPAFLGAFALVALGFYANRRALVVGALLGFGAVFVWAIAPTSFFSATPAFPAFLSLTKGYAYLLHVTAGCFTKYYSGGGLH